jgi:hypothetical protein
MSVSNIGLTNNSPGIVSLSKSEEKIGWIEILPKGISIPSGSVQVMVAVISDPRTGVKNVNTGYMDIHTPKGVTTVFLKKASGHFIEATIYGGDHGNITFEEPSSKDFQHGLMITVTN